MIFKRLAAWQESRGFWLTFFLLCLALLAFAHFFLQNYLFMQPCEQCVYIRFFILLIALACFLAMLKPLFYALKALVYGLLFFAIFLGLKHNLLLIANENAVKNADPFGVLGCSTNQLSPFNLPLEHISEGLFKVSGICGISSPLIPENTHLSSLQSFFLGSAENAFSDGLYSKGWFLLPQFEFLSIAEASFLVFCFFAVVFLLCFLAFLFKDKKARMSFVLTPAVFLLLYVLI